MPTELHPISYHLRNFGQYRKLDLKASTSGNLTLLGENAVGKTTLANAFFPVLIDGSIATPSFNPAKSSDAVAQSTRPRNSTRDRRDFKSMLLGWGKGAYATRTGYTYLQLASDSRHVVLGIGAHRQSDGFKSATWWFVVDSSEPVDLVCTDKAGVSLDKDAFELANGNLGAELRLFTKWEDYRSAVAGSVYGFDSGDSLGKLANAYRLLASPILTAGNARFAPIPNALREAQEPIDVPQIIAPLAKSQQALNQVTALLGRIHSGLDRLARMQQNLFWGNLNHLAATQLQAYTQAQAQADAAIRAATTAEQQVAAFDEELARVQASLTEANAALSDLHKRQAQQAVLEQQRAALDEQIAHRHADAARDAQLQKQLVAAGEQLRKAQDDLAALQDAQAKFTQQSEAVFAQLHARSANMQELTQVLAEVNAAKVLSGLQQYLTQKRRQLADYQHLTDAIAQSNADVALVQGMQQDMGTAIDVDVTGIGSNKAKSALHADNTRIHETGAGKMSAHADELLTKQQQLRQDAPDLAVWLKDQAAFAELSEAVKQVVAINQQQQANTQQQALANTRIDAVKQAVANFTAQIDPAFNAAENTQAIKDLTTQRDALVIDPTLDQQVAGLEDKVATLQQTVGKLQGDRGVQAGRAQAQRAQAAQAKAQIHDLTQTLTQSLETLQPLVLKDLAVGDVPELLTFSRQHRSEIRSHDFGGLGSTVRDLLEGTNRQGQDASKALDALFAELGYDDYATALHAARTVMKGDIMTVPFDLVEAQAALQADVAAQQKAQAELASGNDLALTNYLNAAVFSISSQYQVVPEYNAMLTAGQAADGIRLQIDLVAEPGDTTPAVAEAKDLTLQQRPALRHLVKTRIAQLVADPTLADDDDAFMAEATRLLDTRLWSRFEVRIFRRHSDVSELVDDTFVQSGGSGAEKAQAMVLPLLLVPKMQLRQANADAPHLVMFDEFADKLDPETAKAFAQTIAAFGFNFIATMPSGAQTKILADGVANRAYEVLAPRRTDGKFHANQVHEVLRWQAAADE
ncbi:SbcC/MukB-like Walker B domain-containing protein [Lacticaseibacillus jixiensis]|uniref:SbcC/MukB-like Walker B domain-containing protein n=1 Tax=Lacticaseibacillus jixiensis TaxID=3231926 RepID=UPI0036F3851E